MGRRFSLSPHMARGPCGVPLIHSCASPSRLHHLPKGPPIPSPQWLGLNTWAGGTNIHTLSSCSGKTVSQFLMNLNYTHRVTRQVHSSEKWTLISTGTCAHRFTAARFGSQLPTSRSAQHPLIAVQCRPAMPWGAAQQQKAGVSDTRSVLTSRHRAEESQPQVTLQVVPSTRHS